ncbi:transposase [Gluconobacter cerinus]|nr:transposase [Gluconobacter cerinus]
MTYLLAHRAASSLGLKKVSGPSGAVALLGSLSDAQWMLGDRGYDTGRFRDALEEKGSIKPCIPERRSRERPVKYNRQKYKRRNRIEIMFGRLKDWRRVVPRRYDRSPHLFFSAIRRVATVMFWI